MINNKIQKNFVAEIRNGDASVKSAADNGGITKVSLVEYEQESILTGVYARTCIVAYGE